MLDWTEYAKICLALLVIVNPVGAVPLFASMTSENSAEEKKRIARIASTSVAIVLTVAAVGGQPLLALFGITIASFKVGGAILILLIAIAMMHGEQSGEKQTPDEAKEAQYKERIAVVPLAIPLLSGPRRYLDDHHLRHRPNLGGASRRHRCMRHAGGARYLDRAAGRDPR